MITSSSSAKIFNPGDIVIKKYLGMSSRTLYVIKDMTKVIEGYYQCYDLTDCDYNDVFLGYDKKSNKVKKVA